MKEQVRLTNINSAPTLKAGDIFMAETGGEIRKSQPKNPTPSSKEIGMTSKNKPISPERMETVKKAWERDYGDIEKLPFGERQTIGEAIKLGRSPAAGGAEDIGEYADLKLRRIVDDYNTRAISTRDPAHPDIDRPLPSDELERLIERVGSLRGDLTVNDDESRRLMSFLTDEKTRTTEELQKRQIEKERQREEAQDEYRSRGLYGEKHLTEEEKVILQGGTEKDTDVDKLFNRMFTRVDARPSDEYREAFGTAGQLEFEEFIRILQEARDDPTTDEELRRIYERRIRQYSVEQDLRQVLHNLNYGVLKGIGTEKIKDFAQGFESHFADIAFKKKGVVKALHFYEQAMLQVRAEHNGYLPNAAMLGYPSKDKLEGRVEFLVRENMKRAQDIGIIEHLDDWELNRAISLARGMGIMTGRLIEIAALSELPKGEGAHILSLYAQDIIKDITPIRHAVGKFNIGKAKLRVLGYLMERKGGAWSTKELEDLKDSAIVDIVNGLAPDDKERFLSVLNPFRIGGLFTRTGWRYGAHPTAAATGKLLKKTDDVDNSENIRIGTGMWIELQRGNLTSVDQTARTKAETLIRKSLDEVVKNQPLKILHNIRGLRQAVLERMKDEYSNAQDSKFKEDIELLTLMQEKVVHNKKTTPNASLDFSVPLGQDGNPITNENNEPVTEEQMGRIRKFINVVAEEFQKTGGENKFIEDLRNKEWKLPFILGADDIPFDEYEFANTGSTSLARRWRDIASESTAGKGLADLVTHMESFQDVETIIKALRPIYDGIAGYDEGLAKTIMLQISEGIIKFYKKDWVNRLPFGVGFLTGAISGKMSYAQIAFGRGAMAWDELDVNDFIVHLRQAGFTPDDQKLMSDFKEKVGGKKWNIGIAIARTAVPLLLLAFTYYMLTKVKDEKA